MRLSLHFIIVCFCVVCFSCSATKDASMNVVNVTTIDTQQASATKVKNSTEFNEAIQSVKPGDVIVLVNGIWKDTELKFSANGTADSLIVIKVEDKGKVFFEGQSNVKMGGSYLQLEGLVFRNGFSPASAVISLQKDKNTPCNHCRITECVVDNYNPSERFDTNYWIEIYGKHNRFDHNYLVGKRNRGVTLAVRLKNERDRENFHVIDYNYFGYHPTLGSNGGETIRIGTSHFSLSNSKTTVENNYFERCSGELEIISNKSCQSTIKNNTFFECQGTVTMRHGHETLVENNYIFGNRKPNTGGIRVINENQTVKNNYLIGVTGIRFRGALVVMNGVPNSPLNRYFQVKNSEISNNLVVDCDHIQFCAGSDGERSATPINTTFTNNVIYNTNKADVFTVYDDISGISFKNNIISPNGLVPEFKGKKQTTGFEKKEMTIAVNATSVKLGNESVGPVTNQPMPDDSNTGVSWYPRKDYQINFRSGKTIKVAPGENTLSDAIEKANEGDILLLSSGNYHNTKASVINKAVTIKSTDTKANITFERSPFISLENGGSLELENLNISGSGSDDYSGNTVIRTSRYSMINNYKLLVKSCNIVDLDVNHSFNFLKVYKNTFADSILLNDCKFENITGHVLNLDKEIDDRGIYNVENCVIENCEFKNIGGSAVKLHRGGRDESTFGPMLWLTNSTFDNIGNDKRNKNEAAISIYGVQHAELENLKIKDSRKITMHLVVGDPVIKLKNLELINSEEIYSNSKAYSAENIVEKRK